MAASTAMHKRKAYGRCLGIATACGVLGLASMMACGGDTTGPSAILAPSETFWTLQLDAHTVQLALTAPHNVIPLTATPLNAEGQPLSGIGAISYRSIDSTVTVDDTGLVTARFTTGSNNAMVIASLTDTTHGITLVDTCFLRVTATAPAVPMGQLTLQLPAGAGPQMPWNLIYKMKTTATDSLGNTTTSFPYFTSSDPTIASIDHLIGFVTGVHAGRVTLYASTWAYGVPKKDSLVLDVTVPSIVNIYVLGVTPTGSIHPVLTFWPQVVTVSAGAKVTWLNASLTDSADVVFDDPTNVDSVAINIRFGATGEGNIDPWVQDTTGSNPISARICTLAGYTPPDCGGLYGLNFAMERQRLFPVPGTYHYHSARWGTSGTIVVQ